MTMEKSHDIIANAFLLLLLVMLPLVGLVVAKTPLQNYLEFPPLTRYVQHADFSWGVFVALASVILAVFGPFFLRVLISRDTDSTRLKARHNAFPWWGWLGVVLLGVSWFLAWHRFSWFAPFQIFTFTPIWVGYILVVNGLTNQRTGHCILRDRPSCLLGLFALSAVFWWYFEYLNRFVQNWHYIGIGNLSRLQYFLFASLPFSTVLPAVLSTKELLSAMPRVSAGLNDFIKIRINHTRMIAWSSLSTFSVSLAAIGIWPDYLFPLLWVSPLFMITSFQALRGEKTIFAGLATGNWRSIYLFAVSAIICGFFWELWNYHSFAKWIYTIPFVGSFKVFEMPILGYAGYLPFGPTCAVVAEVFMKNHEANVRVFK
jgi:hypothetical protein